MKASDGSYVITFKQLVLGISSLMCIVVAIILAIGIGLYSQNAVSVYTARLSDAQKALFVDHISQDILTGLHAEVHRKCESFFRANGIASLLVQTTNGKTICSFESEFRKAHSHELQGTIFFDEVRREPAATIRIVPFKISLVEFLPSAFSWSVALAACSAVFLSLLNFFSFSFTVDSWMKSLRQVVSTDVVAADGIDLNGRGAGWIQLRESRDVIDHFKRLAKTILQQQNKLREVHERNAIADLAAQVSHDIRSPLSALNFAVSALSDLPDQTRNLVVNATQRINDIANSLLTRSRNQHLVGFNDAQNMPHPEDVLVATIIDAVASEKRVQFQGSDQIRIIPDLSSSYGLFSNINPSQLSRAISNLLNNAIEALSGAGEVKITVHGYQSHIVIEIKDDGAGIPAGILERIGERGFSYGKVGTDVGTGLGVHHAKALLEGAGGHLKIMSEVGKGTRVQMHLKRTEPPKWFAQKIDLSRISLLVTVDDDRAIHDIWSERASRLDSESLKIKHFCSPTLLRSWFNKHTHEDTFFLIDFELGADSITGLKLITELKIERRSILVTSRYDDVSIQAEAKKLGVQIVPKIQAASVPFCLSKSSMKYDAVLIDDDELVHKTWKLAAANKQKDIIAFQQPSDFFSQADRIHPSSKIFVDVNLAGGQRGETIAEEIVNCGFDNVYLATGFAKDDFVKLDFIKGVVGKDPVF